VSILKKKIVFGLELGDIIVILAVAYMALRIAGVI